MVTVKAMTELSLHTAKLGKYFIREQCTLVSNCSVGYSSLEWSSEWLA